MAWVAAMPDDLDVAYRCDYTEQQQLDALARTIRAFLQHPPSRARPSTVEALERAGRWLAQDSAQITRAWD